MLKVTAHNGDVFIDEVDDSNEVDGVLDGTIKPSQSMVYLYDEEDGSHLGVLGNLEAVIQGLADEGIINSLIASDTAEPTLAMRGELNIDIDDALLDSDPEVAAEIIETVARGESWPPHDPNTSSDTETSEEGFEAMFEDGELTADDKVEILHAAAADYIDSIEEMRREAFAFIETLDEVLDPTDRNAQNAMSRAIESALGEVSECASGKEVILDFQKAQVDRVTESMMWAAASIVTKR